MAWRCKKQRYKMASFFPSDTRFAELTKSPIGLCFYI